LLVNHKRASASATFSIKVDLYGLVLV